MSLARPAATVMVCKAVDGGFELLMLKRSGRAGFFPNAWVFPGGRVDAADHQAITIGQSPNATHPEYVVAAVRECFEESGVWLGEGVPEFGFRDRLNARTATLADAPSLKADLSRMAQWSWWITPEAEPKRYDTRFFLTCLSSTESSQATPDHSETVESIWISPFDAILRHQQGQFFLAPPTLLTLHELTLYSSLTTLWKGACTRRIEEIMPIHRKDSGRLEILLPGHSDHPISSPNLLTNRFTFEQGIWHMD